MQGPTWQTQRGWYLVVFRGYSKFIWWVWPLKKIPGNNSLRNICKILHWNHRLVRNGQLIHLMGIAKWCASNCPMVHVQGKMVPVGRFRYFLLVLGYLCYISGISCCYTLCVIFTGEWSCNYQCFKIYLDYSLCGINSWWHARRLMFARRTAPTIPLVSFQSLLYS